MYMKLIPHIINVYEINASIELMMTLMPHRINDKINVR